MLALSIPMPRRAELKTQYSIAELSEMSGLSTTQVRSYLKRQGVLLKRSGKRNFIVYLGMLTSKAPDFWQSLLKREQLRNQVTSPLEEDE